VRKIRTSPKPASAKTSSYAAAALTGEADKVRTAHKGSRNNTLNASTYTLGRPDLGLDAETITSIMLAAGLDAGLDEREAKRTIRSALEKRGLA
jgi:hypothetical protein